MLDETLFPADSYTSDTKTYWADLPFWEKTKWINNQSNAEARRELGEIGRMFKRDPLSPIRAYFGNSEQLPAGIHSELDFEVELAGSGAAGTAPAWGPLIRACGMSETITAATDVKYAPVEWA